MKLLLTGFEPFGDFATNPSWDALQLADQRGLFECEVALARIPVAYDSAYGSFKDAALRSKPDAAISFGLHGGLAGRDARAIYLETTARNRDGAAKADNKGVTRASEPIVEGGSETIRPDFPTLALRAELLQAGFNAQLSDDAGSYLCNHIFYLGASYCRFPYGFVHVPPVDTLGGTLTLDQLARAVAIVANTLARNLAGAS